MHLTYINHHDLPFFFLSFLRVIYLYWFQHKWNAYLDIVKCKKVFE